MLFVVASILTVVSVAILLFGGASGILLALFSKPIIDATWNIGLGGTNLLQVMAIVVPVAVLTKSITTAKYRLGQIPLFGLWVLYVADSSITFAFYGLEKSPLVWVDLTFRMLSGFVGFYMLQAFFSSPDKFRRLLVTLIFAGGFPIFVGLYQAATGTILSDRMDVTVGLLRNNGLYHDIVAVRMFAFQTLTAIILYWVYFLSRKNAKIQKLVLVIFAGACILVTYKAYSKAAMVIFAVWFLIWTISYRRIAPTIGIFVVTVIVLSFYHAEVEKEIAQLFSKEIAVVDINLDNYEFDRTLAGRWFFWKAAISDYSNRSLIQQLFGSGNPAGIHNEYLGKLLSGGIVGLLIYLALLFLIGKKLVANWLRRRTPLDVMGLMVFAMVLMDNVGGITSSFTTYQWYAWGFIGLALRGIEPAVAKGARAKTRLPSRVSPRASHAA